MRIGHMVAAALFCSGAITCAAPQKPNIIFILADDIGYGDLGCYGAKRIKTPNLDRLASDGLRFADAHAASATCTPSRYALLTGEYPWRKKGTGILPGDAALIIEPGRTTLPSMLKAAGYTTAVVGKWHLGLGTGGIDWNGDIKPGPLEIGFDYAFIIPATGDRVPCVYVENHRIVNADPSDPIEVSYGKPIGDEPTGKLNPELLKMRPSHGHDQTIVNGISRIGYMTGGKKARWVDEDMAATVTEKATDFLRRANGQPFFLYFATQEAHVPRVPHPRFAGKSGCGVRGDEVEEFDWSVGQLMDAVDGMGLGTNTLIIVTSDNGPVVDDGYADGAVEHLNGHRPAGPLRGGKYSLFEGGTRMPFIARWTGSIKPGVSDALICQIDMLATLASLTGQTLSANAAPDSFDVLSALMGRSAIGRDHLVEHAMAKALRRGPWKFIPPTKGPKVLKFTDIESGADSVPQLYDLSTDIGEARNLAAEKPEVAREMDAFLGRLGEGPGSRP